MKKQALILVVLVLSSLEALAGNCKVAVKYSGDLRFQHDGHSRVIGYMNKAVRDAARSKGCVLTSDPRQASQVVEIEFREIGDYEPFLMSGCGGLIMEAEIVLLENDSESKNGEIDSATVYAKGISECAEGARYEYKVWRRLADKIESKLSKML